MKKSQVKRVRRLQRIWSKNPEQRKRISAIQTRLHDLFGWDLDKVSILEMEKYNTVDPLTKTLKARLEIEKIFPGVSKVANIRASVGF